MKHGSGADDGDAEGIIQTDRCRVYHHCPGGAELARDGEFDNGCRGIGAAPILGRIALPRADFKLPREATDEPRPDLIVNLAAATHFHDGFHATNLTKGIA